MADWFNQVFNFTASDAQQKNIGLIRLIFNPFTSVADNIKNWLKIAGIYALFLSILSFVLGFGYICATGIEESIFYCNNSLMLYGVYSLLKVIIFGLFIATWLQLYSEKNFNLKQIINITSSKLKTVLVLLILISLFGFGLLSGYLLMIRIPNPNWKIELSYFTIVSSGFLIPIIATRFYALIAFVAQGSIYPNLKQIWKLTSGQTIKIILSLFALLLFLVFIMGNYITSFRYNESSNLVIFSLLSEFIFNIIVLFFWTLFAGHCHIQAEFIGEKK